MKKCNWRLAAVAVGIATVLAPATSWGACCYFSAKNMDI
jgi:hypothetical protein